jgi:uncharacterized protein
MPFDLIQLALDESVRSYDQDGHLHVRVSHLTKACVNGYHGNEIPNYQQLGLDPYRIYNLLRHPAELQVAVGSFNNKPVLDQHTPVTAADDKRERIIGSTGTDAVWNAPYIDNSLVFWSDHAIALIESGEMRELSSAYRYVPVMQPGVYQGQPYDGVMTQIRANHVALVEAGRAGSDVVVMDSKPKERAMKSLSPRAAWTAGRLEARLAPLLAQDKKLPDFKPILLGTTAKTWAQDKPKVVAALQRATKGLFANDAEVHIHEHLDGASAGAPDDLAPGDPGGAAGVAPGQQNGGGNLAVGGAAAEGSKTGQDDDLAAKVQQLLQGQIDDNDLAIILHALKQVKQPDLDTGGGGAATAPNGGGGGGNGNGNGGGENDDKTNGGATDQDDVIPKPDTERKDTPAMDKTPVTKVAMDAAIAKAVTEATKQVRIAMDARDEANRFVRPWVGDIPVAMDSATDVYKFALEQMGEDVKDIHPSAFKALLAKIPKPNEQQAQHTHIAMDASGNEAYLKRFPHADRLAKH